MPNRPRVLAALPPALAEWMGKADPDVWEAVARETAVRIGRELLAFDGEAVDPGRRAEISGRWSLAAKTVAQHVPPGHRRWTPNRVAAPICAYFELWGAVDEVRRRIPQEVGENAPSRADVPAVLLPCAA